MIFRICRGNKFLRIAKIYSRKYEFPTKSSSEETKCLKGSRSVCSICNVYSRHRFYVSSSSFGCIGPSMVDASKLTERPTEETALKQTPSKKLSNPGKRPSTSSMKNYPETPTRKLKLSPPWNAFSSSVI